MGVLFEGLVIISRAPITEGVDNGTPIKISLRVKHSVLQALYQTSRNPFR